MKVTPIMPCAISQNKSYHRGRFLRTWLSFCIVSAPIIDNLPIEGTTAGLSLLQLIKGVLLAVGILLAFGLYFSQPMAAFNSPAKVLIFYMIYILASRTIIFFINPWITLGHLSYFLFVYVASVVLANIGMIDISWVKRRAAIVILATGMIQIYYYLVGMDTYSAYGTVSVLGGSRGAVGTTAETLALASTVFIYGVVHSGKIMFFLTATLLSIGTLRRTAILSILVTFITAVLVKFIHRSFMAVRPIMCIVFLGLIVTAFLYVTPWGSALAERITDTGGSGRTTLIPLGWESFQEYSMPQKMLGEPGLFYDKMESMFGVAMGTHLEFLDVLLSSGVFGLFFVCYFYAALFRQCVRFNSDREEFYSLFCASIVLFIISLFSGGGTFVPKNIMFCVIAGCSYGILAQTSELIPQVKNDSLSVFDVRQKRIYW